MTTSTTRAPRVLIMDDNPDVSLAMNLMLEREGFEVATAPNPQRALELHHRLPADVLIADVVIPLTGGLETIERFRREFPGTRIVAMARGGARQSAPEIAGADAILRKPLEAQSLLTTLHRLMVAKPRA